MNESNPRVILSAKFSKPRKRLSDFLAKCYVFGGIFLLIAAAFFVCLTETTERRVMYRLLNYSHETMAEKEKYFKLESVPEFKIYPLNENEFKVVFTNGKTVDSKSFVLAGAGDEGMRQVWKGK